MIYCPKTFPATRLDPGYSCDNLVANEGDYCPAHDPGDDENPWADED